MNISIDYDNTYTADPQLWDSFIANARARGHKVYCITYRNEYELKEVREALGNKVENIYATGGRSKSDAVAEMGMFIHVWIDDMWDDHGM